MFFSTDELALLFENLTTILASLNSTALAAWEIKLNCTLSIISYSHTVVTNLIVNGRSYSLGNSNEFVTDVICLF